MADARVRGGLGRRERAACAPMTPLAATALAAPAAGAIGWWAWERSHRRTCAMPGGLHPEITLPHTRSFELYHNAFSLCSQKVRLCLAELGIEYASHHVDLIETGRYENIGRDFLAVNPAGLVPVLVHDGHPIYESHEQIRYAAAHAPAATSLVPDDPTRRDEMQRWVDRASLTGDDPLAASAASAGNTVPGLTIPLFAAMLEEIPVHRIVEGLLFHRLRARPLAFLAMKGAGIRGLPRLGPAMRIIHRSLRHMAAHLDALDAHLRDGGPSIAGNAVTLADVSWAPILQRLDDADSIHVFLGDGRRPAVAAWWARMRARESHRRAIVAHMHPTIVRGTARIRAAKTADPALRRALEAPA
jgi:glutathione S-transferase